MKAFRGEKDGTLSAYLTASERQLLGDLATQVAGLLDARDGAVRDPALRRLLPDAYLGDAAAAAEFRRFTEDALAGRKIDNARALVASLGTSPRAAGRVRLDPAAVQAWLRCLTDIRITLAARLGIEQDGDQGADDAEGLILREIYDWLGFVQGSLVDALSG
jgi:hypothetical protein